MGVQGFVRTLEFEPIETQNTIWASWGRGMSPPQRWMHDRKERPRATFLAPRREPSGDIHDNVCPVDFTCQHNTRAGENGVR